MARNWWRERKRWCVDLSHRDYLYLFEKWIVSTGQCFNYLVLSYLQLHQNPNYNAAEDNLITYLSCQGTLSLEILFSMPIYLQFFANNNFFQVYSRIYRDPALHIIGSIFFLIFNFICTAFQILTEVLLPLLDSHAQCDLFTIISESITNSKWISRLILTLQPHTSSSTRGPFDEKTRTVSYSDIITPTLRSDSLGNLI